ncbi:MAG: hypothetical protein LBJ00_09205 [Planctomycetaceae bacterium]|nr:hypothetical protein [Planctomycetaceae bacterium]
MWELLEILSICYAQDVLKFIELITGARQREAVVKGRSILPYRLRCD